MANSQEEFGATLVVIRDVGTLSASVPWNHCWRHLCMPKSFWGGALSAVIWLVSQDVEWFLVLFSDTFTSRYALSISFSDSTTQELLKIQLCLDLTTPKSRIVKSLSVVGNLLSYYNSFWNQDFSCRAAEGLWDILTPWKDRSGQWYLNHLQHHRDMRWALVHAFAWVQRVLTAFDEDMACVAPVGFACFASMQFSLWKYQVGSLWLPCVLVRETPSQLTHQEEHEKVTVHLSKEGQIKSLWSGGCWGLRGLQRPPHHPAVPRHEPVSPGHTGSSCSMTWGVGAQMSALISSDALGFSGCTGLLSPAQKITLYWLWEPCSLLSLQDQPGLLTRG